MRLRLSYLVRRYLGLVRCSKQIVMGAKLMVGDLWLRNRASNLCIPIRIHPRTIGLVLNAPLKTMADAQPRNQYR